MANEVPQNPSFIQDLPITPGQLMNNPMLAHERVAELANEDSPAGARSPSVIPGPPLPNEPVGNSRLFPDDTDVADADLVDDIPRLSTHASDDEGYEEFEDDSPAVLETASVSMMLTQLDAPVLSRREWMVVLPLPGRLKDEYYKILANSQDVARALLKAQALTPQTKTDAANLVTSLNNLCTHPDLNDVTALSQLEKEGDDEFRTWSEQMSMKFAFLKSLLTRLQTMNAHVVLVCQTGPVVRLLQRFLKLLKIRNYGPGVHDFCENGCHGDLQVTVFCPDMNTGAISLTPAGLVIAFDSAYKANHAAVQSCRRFPTDAPQELSPVLYPFVFGSPEHIAISSPRNIRGDHGLKAQMHFIVQTRKQCGELDPEDLNAIASGEEVSSWLQGGANDSCWTLPGIRPLVLKGVELIASSQSHTSATMTMSRQASANDANLSATAHFNGIHRPISRAGTPISRKRGLDTNATIPGSPQKRVRTEPGEIDAGRQDTSLLASNSMPSLSQTQIDEMQQELANTQAALSKSRLSSSQEIRQHKLQIKNQQDSLNLIFNQRDAAKEALGKSRNHYDGLLKDKEKLERQLESTRIERDRLTDDFGHLKLERDQLQRDYNTIKTQLEKAPAEYQLPTNAAGNGETAMVVDDSSLMPVEPSMTEVRKENAHLKKTLDAVRSELEFVRTQYQQRDSEVGAARKERREMEEQMRRLEAQLENFRATQKNEALRGATLESSVSILKAQVKSMQAQLQKKERDRGRGMATRSGSQAPRSPRFAAGGGSPVGSRVASRGGSPVRREGVASRRGRALQALE